MLKICVYIGLDLSGEILSPVVPRKSDDILYKGKCYNVKNVMYLTKKEAGLPREVSTIGIELE